MLKEIIEFNKKIYDGFSTLNLKPSEGLHITFTFDNEGKASIKDFGFYDGKNYFNQEAEADFWKNCIDYEVNSAFITMNKALDARKKIHSCSPYVMAFKKLTLSEVKGHTSAYFENSRTTCLDQADEVAIQTSKQFENYCAGQFFEDLHELSITKEEKGEKKQVSVFKELKDAHYINVYLADLPIEKYQEAHQRYLGKKIFNTEEYNQEYQEETFGLSGYLNGMNVKKPFLEHRTAPFHKGISGRITQQEALALYQFQQLQTNNRILPNPLPIFIDKKELNGEMIALFNKDGEKPGFAEIIHKLYKYAKEDLGNYYLLNFTPLGKINDFDFVSSFRFKLEGWEIYNLMQIKKEDRVTDTEPIDNIFVFQSRIVRKIFNNSLVQGSSKNEKLQLKYFDDIDINYCDNNNDVIYQLVLKYRKAFYDYIYKSKQQAISAYAFKDIMLSGILTDIKRDDQHDKSYQIKEKLNIWFSLNHHFDTNNQNFKGNNMPTKIPELLEKTRKVINSDKEIFSNDEEFAFATGQLIYFLLVQSKTAQKTHALLEPFLQKVKCELLQAEIGKTIARYKHELDFGHGRFERLAAQVLGYSTSENMQQLQPLLLAGYFSECLIFEKKDPQNQN